MTREVREAFAERVRAVEGVGRIEGTLERLWKGGAEARQAVRLYLGFRRRRPDDFEQIQRAAREAGLIVPGVSAGMSAGLPTDPEVRTATLYEVAG